jgi:putative sigma-54 modulation protein
MKLTIKFRNISGNGELINYIDQKMNYAFSRLRHEIETTNLVLADINGPGGGIDKQCKFVVKPVGLKQIVITERQSDAHKAIYRCLTRASQALTRKLKRRRSITREVITDHYLLSELSEV